jgi:hypothetical protein
MSFPEEASPVASSEESTALTAAPDAARHWTSVENAAAQEKELKGIRGWLILPALATVLSPLILVIGVFELIPVLSGLSADLASSAKVYVAGSMLVHCALLLGWLYAIQLMRKHRADYPAVFNTLLLAGVVVTAADMGIVSEGFGAQLGPDDYRDLTRGVVGAAIWVPYMLRSERVRNTFVN